MMESVESCSMESVDCATAEDVLNHMCDKVARLQHESRRMQNAAKRRDQQNETNPGSVNIQLLEQAERIDQLEDQMKQMKLYLQQMALTHQVAPVKDEETESASPVFPIVQPHRVESATGANTVIGSVPGADQGLIEEPNEMDEGEAQLYSAAALLDAEGPTVHNNLGAVKVADAQHDGVSSLSKDRESPDSKRFVPPTNLAPSLVVSVNLREMEDAQDDLNLATCLFETGTSEAERSVNFKHDRGSSPSEWLGAEPSIVPPTQKKHPSPMEDYEFSDAVVGLPHTKLAHIAPSRSNGDMLKHDLHAFQQASNGIFSSEDAAMKATTAMIRNIACRFKIEDVKMVLDREGFYGKYDDVKVPTKYSSQKKVSNLGYCFVNFTHPSYLLECAECFDGKCFGSTQSKKVCHVTLAAYQGLEHQSQTLNPQRELRAADKLAPSEQIDELLLRTGATDLDMSF